MKHLLGIIAATLVALSALVAQEPMKKLEVAEAKLGKDVQDRALVDETTTFAVNDRVYLWMRVTGGPADSVTVRWKTGDQSYESKLNIGGSSWRTWSYKTAYAAGPWTVTVTDASGNLLKEMTFTVLEKKEDMMK